MEKPNYNSLEDETLEQNEIETGEIKSFKSFLKLCWRMKTARLSIKLGIIVLFAGGLLAYYYCYIEPGTVNLGFLFALLIVIFSCILSFFIIVVGIWLGIKKKMQINFLNLFAIIIIIVYFLLIPLLPLFFAALADITRTTFFESMASFIIFLLPVWVPIFGVVIIYLLVQKKSESRNFY